MFCDLKAVPMVIYMSRLIDEMYIWTPVTRAGTMSLHLLIQS